jgi:cytochrome c biogenesis protein CcmG/thiol:disulfide interchange protein DsbE
MKKFLVPLALFALMGVLLAYGLRLDPRRIPSPLINKPLPDFHLPTLVDPTKIISKADLKGQVVVINVWASWCVACKEEHPVLLELSRQKPVPFIGLNYKDTRENAFGVLRGEGNPYDTVLVDASGRTGIDWGVYGVPESYIVDKKGIIREKQIGPISRADWDQRLWPLIRQLQAE